MLCAFYLLDKPGALAERLESYSGSIPAAASALSARAGGFRRIFQVGD